MSEIFSSFFLKIKGGLVNSMFGDTLCLRMHNMGEKVQFLCGQIKKLIFSENNSCGLKVENSF